MDSPLKNYSGPWTDKQLKHLLSRTLFGVKKEDYIFFAGKSMEECIDVLLAPSKPPLPPIVDSNDPSLKGKSFVFLPENKSVEQDRILMLKGWWVGNMINQQRSITEKLLLFWHNHFVVEFTNINDSRYAYLYLDTLRRNALGNFKQFTKEITCTPAMLVYLNGNQNNKTAPNENYGRELQELFTLGKGQGSNYSENDVKAAAKVLSGWKDDKVNIASYFEPANHDTNSKIFSAFYNNHTISGKVGEEGKKETDELLDMIFSNQEVAKFLCRKLYRWFVHFNIDEKVEEEVISPLAGIMRAADYNISVVLKALFSSANFYDPHLSGGMFKSPCDYLIGLSRAFAIKFTGGNSQKAYSELWALAITLGQMGQDIGDPPSVAGWTAYYEVPSYYRIWLNSENLTFRNKLARLLSYPEESDKLLMIDFIAFAQQFSNPSNASVLLDEIVDFLCVVKPGAKKIEYMESLLNGDGQWAKNWTDYTKKTDDETYQKILVSKLRSLFDVIFIMPEFQIM